MKIESLTNGRVKEWMKLKIKKVRDEKGLFLIEGEHLIVEAGKHKLIKEIISCDETLEADFFVTKEIMKKLSDQVSISSRIAVCYKKQELPIQDKILILDQIQDPGNLGTMIRSAFAFDFLDIVISEDTVDLYNEKVVRASEGMLFSVNVIRKELKPFLEEIKKEYQILTTDVKEGKNIKQVALNKKLALIIGNEGQGVKESIKKQASEFIKIPINKNCESLNAGIAASILMYEIKEKSHE